MSSFTFTALCDEDGCSYYAVSTTSQRMADLDLREHQEFDHNRDDEGGE